MAYSEYMNGWLSPRIFSPKVVGVFLLLFILPLLVILSADKVADPDALYHIRHAWVYRTQSLTDSAFPWVQFSVIKTAGADLWYGFHILLTPFTYGNNLGLNIKIAGGIFAGLMLFSFYHFLRRQTIKWPLVWTLILYVSSADFFLRNNSSRPQTLSLALLSLLMLIFSLPEKSKNKWLHLLVISAVGFAATWIHAAFFWIFLLLGLIYAASSFVVKKRLPFAEIGALIFGNAVGIALRPNPLAAANLLYTQLFRLAVEKQRVSLLLGQDILPLDFVSFLRQLIPFAVLILVAFFLAWKLRKKSDSKLSDNKKILQYTSLVMLVIFSLLALTTARRASDIAIFYGIILAALVMEKALEYFRRPRLFLGVLLAFLLITATRHIYTLREHLRSFSAVPVNRFQEVALWLKANTVPRTIVFHPVWDSFPSLFFWNQNNYYINGMDPIFTYALNQELYWQQHNIAIGGKMYACKTPPPCDPIKSVDIIQIIQKDFHSNYIALDLVRNSGLARNLIVDPRARLMVRGADTALFKIGGE